MEPFNKTVEDLGNIQEGKAIKIKFYYNEGYKILKITTYCGCSGAIDKPKEKYIQVTYTPGNVPEHFLTAGKFQYDAVKSVDILYEQVDIGIADTRTLKIKATVKKRLV